MERIEKRIIILYKLRKERINHVLKDYCLSYEEYEIVLALHYAEGLSIDEIKQETKIDINLIDHILEHLKENDYIYIENKCIFLTDKTKKLYPQFKKLVRKANEGLLKDISNDEYHEMIEMLDKLIEIFE